MSDCHFLFNLRAGKSARRTPWAGNLVRRWQFSWWQMHPNDPMTESLPFHGGSADANPAGDAKNRIRGSIPQRPGWIGPRPAPGRQKTRCDEGDFNHHECRPELQRVAEVHL